MPDTFRNHILRLGDFHALSCCIAAIGKLWGDGGLKDLLVDASVYAAGTVDQMLNGKEFNRAVRALTLAYEALGVSWLDAFFSWCVENDLMKSFPERFWSCLSEVASNFQYVAEMKTSIDVAMDAIERYMLPLMEDFRQYGTAWYYKCRTGAMLSHRVHLEVPWICKTQTAYILQSLGGHFEDASHVIDGNDSDESAIEE